MQIILFTGGLDKKILSGEKTMTARCWRRKPPEKGDIVRAQTGRKKETSFATLKITRVIMWDGCPNPIFYSFVDGYVATTNLLYEIGKKEGFESWEEFYEVYRDFNDWCWHDQGRDHYFIGFELVDKL